MKNERPLLIVTSCTRNYGWVTRAFLAGNTQWADYIIIVDQMSTDGTREMCAEYENVIILNDPDMSYKENVRAKMAFEKGREIANGREAIYFALDIDEIMPANWQMTKDGQRILESAPGDMFQIEWANIMHGGEVCTLSGWQYKVFHDNGMAWQETNIQMHTPLLPYASWNIDPIEINDFPLLHFGIYNEYWNRCKQIYYQFLDVQQKRSESIISIYRTYHKKSKNILSTQKVKQEWLYENVDIIGLVDIVSVPIFVQYIKEIIAKEGIDKFRSIDVWTEELCTNINVQDPRTWWDKMMHTYLRATNKYQKTFLIKAIDKILKKIY